MYLLVHSRAKSEDGKYLSSMNPFIIKYENVEYKSIENAFQAAKIKFSMGNNEDLIRVFNCIINAEPKESKKFGTATFFKKNNIKLDRKKWNTESVQIMEKLLQTRYDSDVNFKNIVDKYETFFHYERSGSRSFWGGFFEKSSGNFVGNNMYGKLLKKVIN